MNITHPILKQFEISYDENNCPMEDFFYTAYRHQNISIELEHIEKVYDVGMVIFLNLEEPEKDSTPIAPYAKTSVCQIVNLYHHIHFLRTRYPLIFSSPELYSGEFLPKQLIEEIKLMNRKLDHSEEKYRQLAEKYAEEAGPEKMKTFSDWIKFFRLEKEKAKDQLRIQLSNNLLKIEEIMKNKIQDSLVL